MIAVEFVVAETQRREMLRDIEHNGGVINSSSEPYGPAEGDPALDLDSRFDPWIIISCAVSTAYLLRQAARAWNDIRHNGGTIIDLRNEKIRLYLLEGVDRGTIVMMTDDAPPSLHRPDDGTDVIRQITERISDARLPPSGDQL